MDTFEKIIYNFDALEAIFKYLNLNEQLKISKICQQFELSITQLIWRFKCKNIIITEALPGSLMVKCNNCGSETLMDYESVVQFLTLCSNFIQHFELNFVEFTLARIPFHFANLTTVIFCKTQVNNEILLQLAKKCLKLSKVQMECCRNFARDPLIMGRDIRVSVFKEMPELNDLTVINLYDVDMNYQILQQFYKIQKLKSLCVKGALKANVNYDSVCTTNLIEHLSIGRFCDQLSWLQFSLKSLAHFQNLTKLFIKMDPFAVLAIDDALLYTLANKCPLLQDLTLEQCKLSIKKFYILTNLSHLTIKWCRGLTGSNLRDIFSEYKLQSFNIINTHYHNDIFDYSYSSNTVKTLTVGTLLKTDITPALTNSFNRFENVCTLIWFQSRPSTNDNTNNSNILKNISYIYPNVRNLLLTNHYIPIEDLKRLKYLKILRFDFHATMSWSYLKKLLQLHCLTNLIIGLTSGISIDIQSNCVTESPDVKTSLEYLKIPLLVFSSNLEFWLVFLQRNTKLKLTVVTDCKEKLFKLLFFERVLSNKKFPKQLKHINICDFNIDCKELKADYKSTVNKFDFKKNDEGEYYIILQNPK